MSRNSLLLIALLALSISYGYAQCSDNCNAQQCQINGKGKCDTCAAGYYLITSTNTPTATTTLNTCAACPTGCATCSSASVCLTCSAGFALASGACSACAANCNTCTTRGAGKCDDGQCKSGYVLLTTPTDATLHTCGACVTGCTECVEATRTTTCADTKCASGYRQIGTAAPITCSACTVAGCATCPAAEGTCTGCKTVGFATLSGNTCPACPSNCDTCTGTTTTTCGTTGCSTGYGFVTGGTCGTCGTQCSGTCANSGGCTTGNCNKVQGYSFLTGSNVCSACASNCYSCPEGATAVGACTSCHVGFGYTSATDKTCIACGSNCASCHVGTANGGKCDSGYCSTGYGIATDGTCGACASNCKTCNVNGRGAGKCDDNGCATGYVLITASGANQYTCSACASGCNTCTVAGSCDTSGCASGYIYVAPASGSTLATCAACAEGCTQCTTNGAGKCDTGKCNAGPGTYTFATNTCVDPVTTASPVSAAFAMTPMQVINSSDTKWYKTLTPGTFTSGTDNTTILYHQYTTTGSGSSYSSVINRRVLNSTSLATTTDLTAITGPSMSSATVVAGSGIGTYGILTLLTAAGNSVPDVQISVVADTATAVTTKLLTAMAATDNGYVVPHNLWYDEVAMIWYASWSRTDTDSSTFPRGYTATYIGGLNVSNGTNAVLYKAGGVAAATYGTTGDTTVGVYGIFPNNVSNSSTATLVYYKTPTGGQKTHYAAQVTLASGAGGSAASLLADATTAGTGTTAEVRTTQSFVGSIASRSTYGLALWTKVQTCPTVGVGACTSATTQTTFATTSSNVYIFFNSSSTSAHNYTLGNTDIGTSCVGTHFGDGYTLHYTITSSTNSISRTYQNFFKNGTNNGTTTAVSLGTFDGGSSLFSDANGALWLGWTNSGKGSLKIYDASVGQVIAQIFLSGNALSSVFAFIALVVAALFAF